MAKLQKMPTHKRTRHVALYMCTESGQPRKSRRKTPRTQHI